MLGNPGFETGTAAPWTATAPASRNAPAEPAHAGCWKAWLDGYGVAHTDTLRQTVTVPAGCTTATLSFWLHVDTAETTHDDRVRHAHGRGQRQHARPRSPTSTTAPATRSGRSPVSVPAGGSVTVTFTGVEGSKLQTSFVVDDAALTVS